MNQRVEERELILKFRLAEEKKKATEKAAKEAKKEYDKIEFQLLDLLEAQDAEASAKYEGIGYVRVMKPRLYASCNVGDMPALFEYLQEVERDDLIKTTVDSGTLSTYVKECIDNGKMEELPECVNYYFKNKVKLYK